MTNIDKTQGASRTSTTKRTNQTDSTDETDETSESAETDNSGQVDTNQTASTHTPPRGESIDRFRGFTEEELGRGPQPNDGGGKVQQAAILRANRQHPDPQMEERKEKLGEALDKQYETMGIDWDADEGILFDKRTVAWKNDYDQNNSPSDDWRKSRTKLHKSLYKNGRQMSDSKIEEVVENHRGRLEARNAFEGFSEDEIENWELGLTQHLKLQRARSEIQNFEADAIQDLPTPSRNLDSRGVDNPDQIRQKLDEWETQQLQQLDTRADELGLERPKDWDASINIPDETATDYTEDRERIQEARNTYEKLMIGDEDGTQYAYPEEVNPDLTVGEGRPRDAYIRHLEENPGDIMGAYRAAEERIKPDQRDKLPDMLANAAM